MTIVLVFEKQDGQSGCVRVNRFHEARTRRLLNQLGYKIVAKIT
jgi:hypothetical protein